MAFSSPAYHIISVPIEKIEPNTYNPNAVAPPELALLLSLIHIYPARRADGSFPIPVTR